MLSQIIIFFLTLIIPTSKPCLPFVALAKEGPTTNSVIHCLQALPSLEPKIKFANFFLHSNLISEFLILNSEIKPFIPHLDYFLGNNKPISYLILLQNNNEMRANGGFFGSYAKLKIENGKLKIDFQDIYVPDGALTGHVEPPAPIQTAFKQGWFKLRDADWEPDFPSAANTIRWFFTKGNEINPDVLVTLNLTTIEKIAKIIGEVDVTEYDFKLNADNLYSLLQNQAEIKAFPGSTQKKDVLSAAGRAVIKKISSLKPDQYLQIGQILADQLNQGNLLVNSTNPEVQKTIASKNWAGQLNSPPSENDTYLLVETNLGANKANCCVERKTTHTISKGETEINHLVNLTFKNNSPLENPLPPRFYGGNYISYLRFYIPENATNIRLTAQPTLPKTIMQYPTPFDGMTIKSFDLKDNYGFREVGCFHLTAAGTSSHIQLSYELPLYGRFTNRPYILNILKQHGLETSPTEINLFGKTQSTELKTDFSTTSPI